MSKITFSEAVKIIPVSESTLRRHMRSGKVSSEKDHGGRIYLIQLNLLASTEI